MPIRMLTTNKIAIKMVYVIDEKNPATAWLEAAHLILKRGDRNGNLKGEILDLIVEIKNPLEEDEKIDRSFKEYIGAKWIEKGADPVFPKNKENLLATPWIKNYWTRLTRFKDSINQLEFVENRLKTKPNSKQLFCAVFDPETDIQPKRPFNPRMPCLGALDFKSRNGKLSLFALFRSQDFGRKAYGNYIGLGKLLNEFCQKVGLDSGKIVCYSRSAHIRLKEYPKIQQMLSTLEPSS